MQNKPRKSNENNFMALLNFIVDPAVIVDEKGHFLAINDAFEELTGLSKKKVIGTPFLEASLLTAESKAILLKNLRKRMQGLPVEPYEINFTDKTGKTRCAEVKAKKSDYAGQPADLVIFRDITRRKENARRLKEYSEKMEALVNEKVKEVKESAQKLRESEEKYRKQFEEALDAIFVADAETGIIIDCNRAATKLVGREKSELVGEHQRILHPPERIEGELSRTFKQHLKEKEGQILETEVITKRGEIRDVAIKANIFDFRGKKLIQGIFRDITERKKMEEALSDGEGKLNAMLQSISDNMSMMDKDLNILWVNETAKKIFGDDIIGKKCYEVYHGRKKPCEPHPCLTLKAFQDGKVHEHDTQVIDKDGKIICFHCTANVALRDKEGKPAAVIEISRDITEHKKMEEALRESVEKYRELINGMNDTAWVIDLDAKFIDVNDAAVEVLGYSREELLSMEIFDIDFTLDPEEIKALVKGMPADEIQVFETAHTTKDGKRIPVEISSSLVTYQGKQAILSIARNITKRKKTEAKLSASAKKYRKLFENLKRAEKQLLEERDRAQKYLDVADVMLVALDTKGRVTLLNRKGCDVLKCTAEEALGKNWFDTFLPKKIKNDVKRHFKLILSGKEILSEYHENPVLAKNGDIPLIWWRHTVLKNNDGRIIGTLSSGEDITEWKQAQQALIDSEEKFRSIVENSADVVMLTLPNGIVSYMSPACFRVLGYNPEDLVGTRPAIFHPDDIEKVNKAMLSALNGKRGTDLEYRIITKAGETRWISHSWSPMLENGKVKLIVSVVRGITERKKMEDELKQERDMLEAVTENIGAGLTIINKDYRILWANKFLKQVYGDMEHKLCYLTYERRNEICPNCGVKKVFEESAAYDAHESSIKDDKGNPVWIELIVTPIKDKDGNVIAALELAVDITEKKNLQGKLAEYSQKLEKLVEKRTEQLKRTQAKLVKSERLATIGELATMVGHDLRNPLTGIMGAAYYLKTKHGTEVGAKGKEMLETIEKAINHSNKIINDLLEYSRDLKLKLTETTPKAMLQSALSLLEVPEKIQVVDATENEPMVKADTEKIRQVFVNIIQNAIDAMPEGGTLTIKSRKVKGKLEIAFKDTGTGMSEETLSNLKGGVPLFTTKSKGMGFGLPICKRIAEAHGGKISVESTAGKGTTVSVTIPVNPEPVDEGEEKWIFSESMLSAITATQRAP